MSTNKLSTSKLNQVYQEVIDHIKRSGSYDEVRMELIDPIWTHSEFQAIIDRFELECERFCSSIDLSLNRGELRSRLAQKFDNYSTSKRLVKSHIQNLLDERREELKAKYYKHAGEYLRRFIPDATPTPPPPPPTPPIPIPPPPEETPLPPLPEEAPSIPMAVEAPLPPLPDETPLPPLPQEIPLEEIPTPPEDPNPPLPEEPSPPLPPLDTSTTTIGTPPLPPHSPSTASNNTDEEQIITPKDDYHEENMDIDTPSEPEDEVQAPEYSPIGGDLERMTFSSVSSVNTADLSDFDNSINLSDDEADIVGKPKNSKVSVDIIQGQIKDLQTNNVEQTAESDGGCSQTTQTGGRVTRTRKSNPRYSNEHYKLM